MVTLKTYVYFYLFMVWIRFPKSRSLHETIRHRYGSNIVTVIRKLEKLDFKHKKAKLDLEFLLNCQRNNVIPNFLYFKLANRRLQTSEEYRDSQRLLLSAEITEKRKNINRLAKDVTTKKTILVNTLNWIDFSHVCHVSITHNERLISKQASIQEKKLGNLLSYLPTGQSSFHDPDKVIFNFSSYDLSESEKRLLCKGLEFAVPTDGINYEDYMLPYELFYRNIKTSSKSPADELYIRTRLRNVAVTTFSRFKSYSRKENNLPHDELEALNDLMANTDIVIQKADKGNTVVICDKSAYKDRMKELIQDDTKFRDLNKEPSGFLSHIINSELRIKDTLYKYCEMNRKRVGVVFSQKQYSTIAPTGTRPGVLYGLAKIHKTLVDNLPKFRPIVSMIGTSTYNLSKFLVPIIAPITSNVYTVKDSFSFAKEIADFDPKLHMSSLDVTSLFTNIPVQETIDICRDELFKSTELVNGMTKNIFRELLALSLKETSFVFDGKLYQQIDGVSMGSPLGPILANAFLCFHEKRWIDNCPADIKPTVYRRYVDDIFVLCRDNEHHKRFLAYMNSMHPSMSFTDEIEKDDKLSFLDVTVSRLQDSDTFVSSLYRKETFSGVFTNFFSFIPLKYKAGLIFTLLFRGFIISSSSDTFHNEVVYLRNVLHKNAYPFEFVDTCIATFLNNRRKDVVTTVKKQMVCITLPYLGKVSLEIRNRLRKLVNTHLNNCDLNIIFKSGRRLRSFFRFKDAMPLPLQAFILYSYTCSTCNSAYYGKSDRHCHVRWCEHLKITPLRGRASKKKSEPTAVQDHIASKEHVGSLGDFKIIGKETSRNSFYLRVKESLLIKRDKPVLNDMVQSTPLELF